MISLPLFLSCLKVRFVTLQNDLFRILSSIYVLFRVSEEKNMIFEGDLKRIFDLKSRKTEVF